MPGTVLGTGHTAANTTGTGNMCMKCPRAVVRIAGFRMTLKALILRPFHFPSLHAFTVPLASALWQTASCRWEDIVASLSSGMQRDSGSSVSTVNSILGFRELIHRCLLGHLKKLRKLLLTALCVLGLFFFLQAAFPDCLHQDMSLLGNHSLTCPSPAALCSPTSFHWGIVVYLHSCFQAVRAARESCLRRQLIEAVQIPALTPALPHPNTGGNRGQD